MPVQTQTYRDLDANFRAHPITGDVSVIEDIEAVKRSMVNLVYTNNYERLEQPDLGCTLSHLLFEQMDPITTDLIRTSITHVISTYEKRCDLLDVLVAPNYENNGYVIQVIFAIKNLTMEPVTFSFFLSRVR